LVCPDQNDAANQLASHASQIKASNWVGQVVVHPLNANASHWVGS
jgi:hypothetical protein